VLRDRETARHRNLRYELEECACCEPGDGDVVVPRQRAPLGLDGELGNPDQQHGTPDACRGRYKVGDVLPHEESERGEESDIKPADLPIVQVVGETHDHSAVERDQDGVVIAWVERGAAKERSVDRSLVRDPFRFQDPERTAVKVAERNDRAHEREDKERDRHRDRRDRGVRCRRLQAVRVSAHDEQSNDRSQHNPCQRDDKWQVHRAGQKQDRACEANAEKKSLTPAPAGHTPAHEREDDDRDQETDHCAGQRKSVLPFSSRVVTKA
jgi:hypothetical protein